MIATQVFLFITADTVVICQTEFETPATASSLSDMSEHPGKYGYMVKSWNVLYDTDNENLNNCLNHGPWLFLFFFETIICIPLATP